MKILFLMMALLSMNSNAGNLNQTLISEQDQAALHAVGETKEECDLELQKNRVLLISRDKVITFENEECFYVKSNKRFQGSIFFHKYL